MTTISDVPVPRLIRRLPLATVRSCHSASARRVSRTEVS
jgi:hypothetical protein